MKRCSLLLLLLAPILVYSQKVGLVFSGGGAKGIAHIGVLKALEENEIPIDYIVGTSMGGIIAGCYAAGMSPTQIEQMVVSEKFLRWVNGLPEKGYNYHYRQPDATPGFLKFTLDLDSTFNFQFNSSIANDVSLNFALAEKMAQASAISKNNFDSLFIPLRVLAADIFTQNEVVLANGSLSDALRATQTVPLFYKPIRVGGKYLFDGGLYNNFPVDVLQREFVPDVIIGSNVSSKVFEEYPFGRDDKLISHSLLFMLLDKSDPSQIPQEGIYLQPNLKGYSAYDFTRIRGMIDSGYVQTLRQIEEIKGKIKERQTCESLAARRNAFHDKNKPLLFDDLTFRGFNSRQRGYIRKIFKTHQSRAGLIPYTNIKKGYFRLVSEEYFSNVHPNIFYDDQKNAFSLGLSSRPRQNFQIDLGGVVASRNVSNIFVGFNYYYFGRTLTHISATTQNGSFYKSAALKVRLDFPMPFYVEPYISFDNWNYLENDDLIQEVTAPETPTVLKRTNRKYALRLGLPVREYFKSVFYIEGFNNEDRYIDGDIFISTDILDRLQLTGFKTGFTLASNTLDRKQYASRGEVFSITADFFRVEEFFDPGNTSVKTVSVRANHQWFRIKGTAEQYFGRGRYRYGYLAEAVFSNQPPFQNYFGTIINAPAFLPMQDSRTLILQNFRSFNYTAFGIRNIFSILKKLDLRVEGYLFRPFDYLQQNTDQEVVISHDVNALYKAGTIGFVYHTPVGPASLSVNYYDDNENQFGGLFHIGFLLYNKHSLE